MYQGPLSRHKFASAGQIRKVQWFRLTPLLVYEVIAACIVLTFGTTDITLASCDISTTKLMGKGGGKAMMTPLIGSNSPGLTAG
jgi:hypothetical protein